MIAPCEPPYSAGVTDDLAALMPPGARPIALFRVLAHNPRILSRFRAGRLLDAGALSMRERELLILRVSHRCDCDYEWSVHVAGFSHAAGLGKADLHATLQPTAEAPLSSRERLIALVGRYVRVSMIANAVALPRESGVRPWAGSIQ